MSHPTIYWAQDQKVVFMQIALMGATEVKLDIDQDKVTFSGKSENKSYNFEFALFKQVNKDKSKYRVQGTAIEVLLVKEEKEKEFWPTINKGNKLPYVRIDWNRWIDEEGDEKPKSAIPDFSGMKPGDTMPDGSVIPPGMDMSKFKKPEDKEESSSSCEEKHEHHHCHCGEKECCKKEGGCECKKEGGCGCGHEGCQDKKE